MAATAAAVRWSDVVGSLVPSGTICGCCLIASDGRLSSPTWGSVAESLQGLDASSPLVRQFLAPFATLQPTTSFTVLGQKLLVVRQDDGSLYALGRGRKLGLAVCQVPEGVLVLQFGRDVHLPVAASRIERCCGRLRAAATAGGAAAVA